MSLDISDGFNFALGQQLAELLIGAIVLGGLLGLLGIAYVILGAIEYIQEKRRERKE